MYLINYKHGESIEFKGKLDTLGVMVDFARGMVFKVSYIKELIRKYSLMGINEFWMYLEDVYELENYPVFGYVRGKYTKEEITEIVEYAKIFEVHIIPAIQTLGHMDQFLRWGTHTLKYKDQSNVLIARDEGVYKLIKEMLETIKEMFQTDKIHIGLDETWGFGFGLFYKKHGYVPQIDIFLEHLNYVNNLALEIGFKDIMIWSDMFFRIFSKTGDYYDADVTLNKEIADKIPKNLKLVYWDYYNSDEKLINKMLSTHKQITDNIAFATGTWIWTKFTYDKKFTDKYIPAHLKATFDTNIKDLVITQWMDDGAYGDMDTTLIGVFEIAYQALTNNPINKDVYLEIAKESYEVSVNRTKLNDVKWSQGGMAWDDPQYAVYLNSFTNNEEKLFNELINKQKQVLDYFNDSKTYYFEHHMANFIYHKMLGRKAMVLGYRDGKINAKKHYKAMIKSIRHIINHYKNVWYKNNKMFGLEVIQSRFATQIERANEMIDLERKFNAKKITHIDGLDDQIAIFNEYVYEMHSLLAFTTKQVF